MFIDEFIDGENKKPKKNLAVFIVIAVLAGLTAAVLIFNGKGLPFAQKIPSNATQPGLSAVDSGASALVQSETNYLVFMREEEILARDLYLEMHRLWGLSVFKSIAQEEQEHTDAMRSLLRVYGVPDPVQSNQVGKYVNGSLTGLHSALSQQGQQSAQEALKACALQEEINMLDLTAASAVSSQPMIKDVYAELLRDSSNHLRSFAHALEVFGVRYQAVRLPQQTVDTLIHGPMDRGFMRRKN